MVAVRLAREMQSIRGGIDPAARRQARPNRMRLTLLLLSAILAAGPAVAQQAPASAKPDPASHAADAPGEQPPENAQSGLPVSLDKIRDALQQPSQTLRGLDEILNFKIEIHERSKMSLDDLIKSLDFKAGPVPAGGVYGYEQQRQTWNPTDHPLQQPYAAFSQPELLTVLVENLVGKYLAGKAVNAVTSAERAHAEAAAREEVHRAIAEYCAAQPNHGAGIDICSSDNR